MIYFDSAATTFQKPRTVADAMRNAMATMSSPGRAVKIDHGLTSRNVPR